MEYRPKKCKRCGDRDVARNGYCLECIPDPMASCLFHSDAVSADMCLGWQSSESLPDGRTLTVVSRLANYADKDGVLRRTDVLDAATDVRAHRALTAFGVLSAALEVSSR